MRDAEGRKKEASKVIQTTKQSNAIHPRRSLFQLSQVGFEPMTLYTLDRALYQLSCFGWDSNPHVCMCVERIFV